MKKKLPPLNEEVATMTEPVTITIDASKVRIVANIQPLTQEFGNGDLNILRDKINELINLNA